MKILPFRPSYNNSVGIELEFQLVDPITFDLISRAKDFIRHIRNSPYQEQIKPEITQSMIEINSSAYSTTKELYEQLIQMRFFLLEQADALGIKICGGGTHPFQKWAARKIFPTSRFKNKSRQFRYLSKRSTVFGQHVHVGCTNAEEALYLTHALARYVPQLIAIAASSPFYQENDTGYQSSRLNVFNCFPTSGAIPYLMDWKEFSEYFYKMRHLGVVQSMKDFYWDIRPKPEFGTVEVRIFDTPLTIKKSVMIAAYLQTLARYLVHERPIVLNKDLYYLYNHNRFQACRYGLEGEIIDASTLQPITIADDIVTTIKKIEKYGNELGNMSFIAQLLEDVINKNEDATRLRKIFNQVKSLRAMVHAQCEIWKNE